MNIFSIRHKYDIPMSLYFEIRCLPSDFQRRNKDKEFLPMSDRNDSSFVQKSQGAISRNCTGAECLLVIPHKSVRLPVRKLPQFLLAPTTNLLAK